jgi:endonuclease/exonuclease/phosphatase family metal-dependent hydrolase
MRWLPLCLIVAVSAAAAAVSHRPTPRADGRLRVVTFNIHKGADRRERYDLSRTIAVLAALDADVIGLQEVLRNHPGYGCDDQPALVAKGLQHLTGASWQYVYERAWNTDKDDCLRTGRGDGPETEGLAIFARTPVLESRSIRLSEGRIGLAARVASLPRTSIAVTHLSAARDDQAGRARELALLLPWATGQPAHVLMGDFNTTPQTGELGIVQSMYEDAWSRAALDGTTRGVESGATRPGRRQARIDYVFFDPAAPLVVDSVEVVDTSAPGLDEASDHRPVVATFRMRD